MKCPFCNCDVPQNSNFCTNCGKPLRQQNYNAYSFNAFNAYNPNEPKFINDKAGGLAIFVSLIWPFIGFMLYVVWKNYKPKSAKTCLITGIIGLIVFELLARFAVLVLILVFGSIVFSQPPNLIIAIQNVIFQNLLLI